MIIFFNGFWGGFSENTDPIKSYILMVLLKKVFNENVYIGNINNSDILIESVFNKSYLNYKKWRYTFLFNGEAEHVYENLKYDCILSGRYTDLKKNVVNFPLFIYYIFSNNYLSQLNNNIKIECVPKKSICAIISNGNSVKRNNILNKLEEHFTIDYAGKYRNNTPKIKGTYNSNEILHFYSQYKFVLCLENTKQETYITEKIVNGFLVKTIPIYWGSNSINDYFNEERFINIPNVESIIFNNIIEKIKRILNDDEEYLKIVNKPIFTNNLLSRNIFNIAQDVKTLLGK